MDPTTDLLPLRDRLRMTQQAFADAYGLTLGAVKDWETGRRKPDSAALAYLRTIAAEPETVRRIQAQARGKRPPASSTTTRRPRLRDRMLIPDALFEVPTAEIGKAILGSKAPPSPPFRGVQAAARVREMHAAAHQPPSPPPVRVRVPVEAAAPAEPPSPPLEPAYTLPDDDPGLARARLDGARAGARMGAIREALRQRAFNGNGGR